MHSKHASDLVVHIASHCMSMEKNNIIIGKHCEINGRLSSFENGKITVGDNLYMGYRSFIGAMESISIGNNVIISSDVKIYDNNNHPTSPVEREKMCHSDFHGELWTWKYADHKPVIINDNVWIGENATILKGVSIGRGSIVASHSVVTKDVPEYVIVAGNPARVVKQLNHGESK